MRAAMLFALLMAPAEAAEWVRVASPGIELLTDAAEKTGRQVLGRFEQIHRLFHQANIADSALPLRVFLFASEEEFQRYRDDTAVDGFYRSGIERDYIVMHAGASSRRVAAHEYVHVVLNQSRVPLPKWFDEGMAEFYSTFEVERGRLSVGKPIEAHVALLSAEKWLSAAQLSHRDTTKLFYAQSWALVHMLNLGTAWRDGLPQFILLLEQGSPPEEAFVKAFGRTMGQAIADLPAYLRGLLPATIAADIDRAAEIRIERIPTPLAALARADLALATGRRGLARTLLEQAARVKPDSPEVAAGMATLALAEDRRDDARRHLEHAIALGSRDGATYFEYAMIERDSGATLGRVDQLLEKTIAVNPNLADAQFLLGAHASDNGNYTAAVDRLREATRLRPQRSYFWHALGYAQWKLGRREEALESARRAVATAENSDEAGMAEGLLSLVQRKPETPSVKRPAVITPPSWHRRKGDARLEGTLIRVDCQGSAALLQVTSSDGKTVTLEVKHPGEVEMTGVTHEFSCGPQNLRVIVEYLAVTGEVTRIEFPQ